jgi:hypothetical protein
MKQKINFSTLWTLVKRYPLGAILTLALVGQLYEGCTKTFCIQSHDTSGYVNAAGNLMNGNVDIVRTPSYPLVIALCRVICSNHILLLVSFFQILAFLVSIVCLYKILQQLGIRAIVAFVSTLIYGCYPMLLIANVNILTESLSVSFSVFFIYFFVRWVKENDWKVLICLFLCFLFLTFLRPSFIYLNIALVIVAVLYFFASNPRRALQLLSIVCLNSILLFGYCKQIEAQTGVFTITRIRCDNEYTIAYNRGLLTLETVSDSMIRQRIIEFESKHQKIDVWDRPRTGGIPLKACEDAIQRIKSMDIVGWYWGNLVGNLKKSWSGIYDVIANPFRIYFPMVYSLLVLTGGYLAYDWYHRRKIPMISLLLWLMCVGNIMVNLLGSYAEWSRLFLPSIPILIMLLAVICNRFKIVENDNSAEIQ